jgi:hypothetical protein
MQNNIETTPKSESPKVVAQALHKLLKDDGSAVRVTHNKKHSIKVPIKNTSVQLPHTGPIAPNFLRDNKINIFHYSEGKRKVTIAYTYIKGDEVRALSQEDVKPGDQYKRFVKYGATIFHDESDKTGKKEVYNKQSHNWTAISRLLNAPVSCELNFYSAYQFKKELRKFMFDKQNYGVSTRKATKYFQFDTDNVTNVALTVNNENNNKKSLTTLDV